MANICRTCFKFIQDNASSFNNPLGDVTIKESLAACIPELNLEIGCQLLCSDCLWSLKVAYEFRVKCLDAEVKIGKLFVLPDEETVEIIKEEPIFLDIKEEVDCEMDVLNVQESVVVCSNCLRPFPTACDLAEHTTRRCNLCDQCDGSGNTGIVYKSGCTCYKCKVCEKKYTKLSQLQNHEGIHKPQKQHKCKFCDHKFAEMRTLLYHMRSHAAKRPYHCSVCSKSFVELEMWQCHIGIHKIN